MRVVVYGAFERAAWSESARSHVACLARVLGAHIVVVGDCPRLERGYFWGVSYSLLAHDVEREVDMERLSRNPGQWVNAMREMLQAVEGEIVAVVAPHSPRALRLLSLYAASAGVVFWGNMMASGLPECARVVCAHRVGRGWRRRVFLFVPRFVVKTCETRTRSFRRRNGLLPGMCGVRASAWRSPDFCRLKN